MRKLFSVLVILSFLAVPALAQNQSQIARASGRFYANAFNTWNAKLTQGFTGIGAQGGTVYGGGAVSLKDGTIIYPFNTNAPLLWDAGQAGQENLTTVGVAGCSSYSTVEPSTCVVAAVFANPHGRGALLKSGTFGLQEAINFAYAKGGGVVVIDRAWTNDGGTDAIIAAAAGYYNVVLEDLRGPVPQYKVLSPATLVNLATPATRSAVVDATEVRSATTAGTFAAAPQFVCVTYVDPLGGESPCSGSYNFTPADALHGIYFASPAAATGAVGWRAYAGITGVNTQYRLPISASTCTLSTLVGAYPACAIGSAATFTTPTTATDLAPGYTANTYRPVPQSHSIMAYAPVNAMPLGPVQTQYGPFAATAAVAATQPSVLGTARLPDGFLNTIGKTIRVSGQITYTAVNTATPNFTVAIGPSFTTGTPTNMCVFANTTALGAAVYNAQFSCTMTVNAVGAAGTIMAGGTLVNQLAGGTTTGSTATAQTTAAVTADIQTYNNSIYIFEIFTTAGANPTQLLNLHVESLN
jgi:hypothetical protein